MKVFKDSCRWCKDKYVATSISSVFKYSPIYLLELEVKLSLKLKKTTALQCKPFSIKQHRYIEAYKKYISI